MCEIFNELRADGDISLQCVRFHPNSLYLATGSSDWTARLWDVQRGACVRVFIGHQGSVSSLAMSPDGRYLASSGWTVPTYNYLLHSSAFWQPTYPGEDLAINIWDLGSGKRIKKMTGHTASIYSLAFSAESSVLVSGGADWTVRCWDVKGAGGLPGKPKENGYVLGNGHMDTGKGYDEEENVETYVPYSLWETCIDGYYCAELTYFRPSQQNGLP